MRLIDAWALHVLHYISFVQRTFNGAPTTGTPLRIYAIQSLSFGWRGVYIHVKLFYSEWMVYEGGARILRDDHSAICLSRCTNVCAISHDDDPSSCESINCSTNYSTSHQVVRASIALPIISRAESWSIKLWEDLLLYHESNQLPLPITSTATSITETN